MFGLDRHVESLADAVSESTRYTRIEKHHTLRPRPPAALPYNIQVERQSIGKMFTGLLIRSNSQHPSDRATAGVAWAGI